MTALMPAGLVTIKEPDRKGIMRNVLYWSDDGTPAGNLTPVEYDGGNVAATAILAHRSCEWHSGQNRRRQSPHREAIKISTVS